VAGFCGHDSKPSGPLKGVTFFDRLTARFSRRREIMDVPTSFIRIIILFDEDFKYGDGAKFGGYVFDKGCTTVCITI
jgi:hypothetical protein